MESFGAETDEEDEESPWTLRKESVLKPARDLPLSWILRLNASAKVSSRRFLRYNTTYQRMLSHLKLP